MASGSVLVSKCAKALALAARANALSASTSTATSGTASGTSSATGNSVPLIRKPQKRKKLPQLEPAEESFSLDTITRAAKALGKRVTIRTSDAKLG
jgi:hypothetical protein